MSDNAFAATPLITPERLKLDYKEALSLAPIWAGFPAFTEQDFEDNAEGLKEDVLAVAVGTSKDRPGKPPTKTAWMLGVCASAILFELTRYGNSAATNGNGGPNEKPHFRVTFAGSPEDNQTAQRLVTGAGLRAQCVMNPDNRRDLRAEGLSLTGGGKAVKEAREVAVAHALENARKYGADVEAYERNLWALFILHDDLHRDPHWTSLSY